MKHSYAVQLSLFDRKENAEQITVRDFAKTIKEPLHVVQSFFKKHKASLWIAHEGVSNEHVKIYPLVLNWFLGWRKQKYGQKKTPTNKTKVSGHRTDSPITYWKEAYKTSLADCPLLQLQITSKERKKL